MPAPTPVWTPTLTGRAQHVAAICGSCSVHHTLPSSLWNWQGVVWACTAH